GKVLAGYFRDHGIPAEGYASIPEALDALLRMQYTTHAPILCFGSLYSAGDIRRYFGKNAE
ncbi:MAG: hypothetical protein MJ175_08445, partial [Clostridia bacterium]|nr:hypothetical protein [Clostridia bacterium]